MIDRVRLAKLLAQLEPSQPDAVALTAARAADKMVRGSGFTWRDILEVSASPPPAIQRSPQSPTAPNKAQRDQMERMFMKTTRAAARDAANVLVQALLGKRGRR